jgi:transposase
MRQKTERHQEAADRTIKDIRRQTRRKYTAEDKIRIVLSGLKGEDSIAELCRQEGIAQSQYYSWSKRCTASDACIAESGVPGGRQEAPRW